METLADLRQALPGFGFNDYVRHLKFAEERSGAGTPLRVAVLRSYTVEPIEPVLRLQLLLDGFQPSCWFGGYNQYAQEILEPAAGLRAFRPAVVLLLVRLEELVPDFIEGFPSRPAADWNERLAAKARELAALAGRAAEALAAPVLVQGASLSRPHFGIFDAQGRDSQQGAVEHFNRALSAAAADVQGVFIWDFDRFVRTKGTEHVYDAKAWYVARNPFRQAAYPAIADDLCRYIRSMLGRIKKCVVVDLDNTLWGGLAGEDGLEGVRLGHAYPGNCYRDFQRALLTLHDRGILLAINSKNNEADAMRIIDEHPDMVLRRHHFAATRINWRDKASNLRDLAAELNIGLDSMIFLDDSPAECALVRHECPECDVVLLPGKPYQLPALVDSLPGIETIRLTDEDRRKGEMYRAQAARRSHEDRHTNLEEFLRSLEIEVAIEPATPFSVPRIAQLTQKTNQWNMTTRRYTEAQVRAFAADPACVVLAVSSRDRFGDDGIVGACILSFTADECVIDTCLLSCRVIGRGIEQLVMAHIVEMARSKGMRSLAAEFIPTKKNTPAAGFYDRAGLIRIGGTWHRAMLRDLASEVPGHIRLTAASPGSARPAAALESAERRA